jgi:hypothetical protein
MTTADQKVEEAADKLQQFADRMAGEGGLKSELAEPLAEDADLIRKMKPSLIKARARKSASRKPRRQAGGPNPWLVVGVALAAGIILAKLIDRRGNAGPRD